MHKRAIAVISFLWVVATASAQPAVDAKVNELLGRMTLEEKIGQLAQIGGIALLPNSPKPEEAIRRGEAGSVLWLSDAASINRVAKDRDGGDAAEDSVDLRARCHPRLPDAVADAAGDGGVVGHGDDRALAGDGGPGSPRGGHAWTFAPMVDIARDPRWGRIIEGAGRGSVPRRAVARAQVRGFQGRRPLPAPTGCSRAPNTSPDMARPTAGGTTTRRTYPSSSYGTSTCRLSAQHWRRGWALSWPPIRI